MDERQEREERSRRIVGGPTVVIGIIRPIGVMVAVNIGGPVMIMTARAEVGRMHRLRCRRRRDRRRRDRAADHERTGESDCTEPFHHRRAPWKSLRQTCKIEV